MICSKIACCISNSIILSFESFNFELGKLISVVGDSGCGKTTMLNIIGLLQRQAQGNITMMGKDVTRISNAARAKVRLENFGFIYQNPHLIPELSVMENVKISRLAIGVSDARAQSDTDAILENVGMLDKSKYSVDTLSGGEKQRVAIARALVNKPRFIFADEPTGNLDDKNAGLIFDLFVKLVQQNESALFLVTHNHAFAQRANEQYTIKNKTLHKLT